VKKVAVLGATGMVGRRLVQALLDHPTFALAMVVGSEASAGESYEVVWEQKERALREHYGSLWQERPAPAGLAGMRVSSFSELLASECAIVFSSIPARAGALEDALVSDGRVVFSNSPYRRFDGDVPLVVPEVNGHAIEQARLVKTPNCVTCGLLLVLAPLEARYGLREVAVTTYQSLSGRGDAKYAQELVLGNVYPLHASPEDSERIIWAEVKKILGDTFRLSITCNRTCVQEGHFVEVRVKTRTPIASAEEAASVLASFNPLGGLRLYSAPPQPNVVLREPGRPRPRQDASHHNGMAIAIGNLTNADEVFDLRLTYVVNNLLRGAAGGVILSAELWAASHAAALSSDQSSAA
jgi:aspartate-semialdehyde dehydrogenase